MIKLRKIERVIMTAKLTLGVREKKVVLIWEAVKVDRVVRLISTFKVQTRKRFCNQSKEALKMRRKDA